MQGHKIALPPTNPNQQTRSKFNQIMTKGPLELICDYLFKEREFIDPQVSAATGNRIRNDKSPRGDLCPPAVFLNVRVWLDALSVIDADA
jgi:hypothetical protein